MQNHRFFVKYTILIVYQNHVRTFDLLNLTFSVRKLNNSNLFCNLIIRANEILQKCLQFKLKCF